MGYETYGATMDNITFKNITIIHNYHKAAMSIHNCDDAEITNVTYQSITIEDAQMLGDNRIDGLDDLLIDITIAYNAEWTKSGGDRGKINGVTFENIKVLSMADTIISRINGESHNSSVNNVRITGVEIEGEQKESAARLGLISNDYVNGVSVGKADYEVFGAGVKLPYTLDLQDANVAKTIIASRTQNGLEVPEFALMDVKETYMGVKLESDGAVISTSHGKGQTSTSAYDDGTGDFGDAAAAFDGDRSTAYVAKEWTGEKDEFAALTVDFGEIAAPGVVRVYLAEDSPFVYDFNVSVFSKRSTILNGEEVVIDEKGEVVTDKNGNTKAANFSRVLSNLTYSSTPASGNYFDIKLSASLTCTSIQLRFFRVDGMTGQQRLEISEIAFYPSSLSTTKSVDATKHFDVYPADYAVDGNVNTYWEAETQDAYFTVDLGAAYDVKYIVMHLPPVMTWPEKFQKIEIQTSTDGVNWTTAVEEKEYSFNPAKGNSNTIELATPVRARYVKLVFSSNSSGYGAQLSELYVYGE